MLSQLAEVTGALLTHTTLSTRTQTHSHRHTHEQYWKHARQIKCTSESEKDKHIEILCFLEQLICYWELLERGGSIYRSHRNWCTSPSTVDGDSWTFKITGIHLKLKIKQKVITCFISLSDDVKHETFNWSLIICTEGEREYETNEFLFMLSREGETRWLLWGQLFTHTMSWIKRNLYKTLTWTFDIWWQKDNTPFNRCMGECECFYFTETMNREMN